MTTTIWDDVARMPIGDLHPHPQNPRRGNVPVILDSLEALGQFRPIVVNVRDGRNVIVAGHHLWKAAKEAGLDEVLVLRVDVDERTHRRMMVVDNRSSDLGTYDDEALEALLREVAAEAESLAATGYTEADLARMFGRDGKGYDADVDEVPDVPAKPKAKVGDVWLLGPHRLAVGDSTDPAVIGRALGGEQADVLWTDPPYGVSYVGGTGMTIQNDGADEATILVDRFLAAAIRHLKPGAPCYVAHSEVIRIPLEQALRTHGYLVRQNLIWVKNAIVLGRSDYQYKHEPILEAIVPDLEAPAPAPDADADPLQHEPILYGFTPGGEGRLGRGGDRWFGNNAQATVFEVDKPRASREHPTMKPTDLIVKMLKNSLRPGGLVLDTFGGSGSTLVAADSLDCRAALVELDPKYADVICARYERLTGIKAVKEKRPART